MNTNSSEWEQLAGEAIADAAEWKTEARKAQAQRGELLAALRLVMKCWKLGHKPDGHAGGCARAAIAKAEVQS